MDTKILRHWQQDKMVNAGIRQVAGDAADEIERLTKECDAALGNADMNYQKWVEAQAEIKRLRAALEEYACNGLANCPVQKLKDGTCIHAGTGHCGDGAFVALQPIIHEQLALEK